MRNTDRNLPRLNIVAVKLPANTTNMQQPCDQKTNKVYQQEIRRTRDVLLSMSHFSWANTAIKINLAVAAHRDLTPDVSRSPFVDAGLWPMDFGLWNFSIVTEYTIDRLHYVV